MNFSQWTYKQRNRYLMIAGGAFTLMVYLFAIRNTVELYGEVSSMEEQLSVAAVAPQKIQQSESKLANLDSRVSGFMKPESFGQETLLGIVSGYCQKNRIVLREFPKPGVYRENDYEVETFAIAAEGSFMPLLKLAYELEQNQRAGRIASLRFQMKKDLRSRRKFLELVLYLQNIKKTTS